MALITPNFEEVAAPIEPGPYMVRIVKAETGEWKNAETGKVTPNVCWHLETFGESTEANNGRRIFDRTATAGKGAFRLQNLYRAAVGENLTEAFDTEQLLGKELSIVVDVNAKGYPEVKGYSSLG